MQVVRLLMVAVLLILATLCFELAGNAAQDTGEVLRLKQAAQPDFVVCARVAAMAVPSPPAALHTPVDEFEAPEWVEPAPEPKPVTKRRHFKRPVAKVAESGLVAPEDAIRMVLRRKRSAFEHCYEQELKKQASFDGFLVVSLSLSANGRVTEVHVEEGTRRDAQVGACIVAQLRRLQLPPLTEGADLLIPIRLQAKKPS